MSIKFKNCIILATDENGNFSVLKHEVLCVENDKISYIGPDTDAPSCDSEKDMKGAVLMPGIVNAAETTTVNIHYLRDDGAYGDWDVWAWADGLEGAGYAFTDSGDADGAVATITITEATPSLGFIVRKPDWSAKDPDGDRSVDLSSVVSGTVDVYCKAGSELDDFTVNFDNAVFGRICHGYIRRGRCTMHYDRRLR